MAKKYVTFQNCIEHIKKREMVERIYMAENPEHIFRKTEVSLERTI